MQLLEGLGHKLSPIVVARAVIERKGPKPHVVEAGGGESHTGWKREPHVVEVGGGELRGSEEGYMVAM